MTAILISQTRQAGFVCYPLILVLIVFVLPGCVARGMISGQFSERLQDLKSVSIALPKVEIYEEYPGSGGNSRVFSAEQSSAAEINFANAVKRHFEAIGRFTVTNLDLNRDPQAAREFKFLTVWDPSDLHFIGRSAPPCVPFLHPGSQERRPLLALREAAQADAVLLTYGLSVDKSEEAQRKQSLGLSMAYLIPYAAMVMVPMTLLSPVDTLQSAFGSGRSAVQICLIDTKTGDELWSYFGEFNGRDQLTQAARIEAIVEEAFKSFRTAASELKER